jgi:Integrase core domain
VTAHPTAAWRWRQLVDASAWGRQARYLLRDRERVSGGDVVPRARRLGIETLLSPVRAPRANAIAERVIGTLRREGLDLMVILSEPHLRAVLAEFVHYYNYNAERPHRTLHLEPPQPVPRSPTGSTHARPVLGGLHHIYERAAGATAGFSAPTGSTTATTAPPETDGVFAPNSILHAHDAPGGPGGPVRGRPAPREVRRPAPPRPA